MKTFNIQFGRLLFANKKCFGIFAPLKNEDVKAKIKIPNKVLVRLAIFAALITGAFFLNSYLDHNPDHFKQEQPASNRASHDQGAFILYNPANTLNARSFSSETPTRFLHTHAHDKLLQKYYQSRNFHVFKTNCQKQKVPIVLSYHFIVFRDYFSDVPDDVPLNI